MCEIEWTPKMKTKTKKERKMENSLDRNLLRWNEKEFLFSDIAVYSATSSIAHTHSAGNRKTNLEKCLFCILRHNGSSERRSAKVWDKKGGGGTTVVSRADGWGSAGTGCLSMRHTSLAARPSTEWKLSERFYGEREKNVELKLCADMEWLRHAELCVCVCCAVRDVLDAMYALRFTRHKWIFHSHIESKWNVVSLVAVWRTFRTLLDGQKRVHDLSIYMVYIFLCVCCRIVYFGAKILFTQESMMCFFFAAVP